MSNQPNDLPAPRGERLVLIGVIVVLVAFSLPLPARAADSSENAESSPEWVKKTLARYDSAAVVDLGLKYSLDNGRPRDFKQAVQLFTAAASVGDARAEFCLSLAFAKGDGVPLDSLKALDWLKASARTGYSPAQSELGRDFFAGKFEPPDYPRAFEWSSRAATQGFPQAQADLGIMCQKGLGTKSDVVEAWKWFQLAVAAGLKDAVARRDEVFSLMDAAQQREARRRVQSFKPEIRDEILPDDSPALTCPLGNYFQIPVRIFGKTNFLIVDTGSTAAVLDVACRTNLGEPLASLSGSTGSSSANFDCWDCPEIFIGGQRFAPLFTLVEDLQPLRQASGESIQGILGMSCLKYEVVGFDFDNRTFTIGGAVPDNVKQTALVLPLLRSTTGDLGIEASINGHGPFFLMMDSGDTDAISLNQSDWQKVFGARAPKSRRAKATDIQGKITENYSARLQSLVIGTNTYKDLLVGTLANPGIPSRFGQAFLERHICFIDFPARLLYLLPGRRFDSPMDFNMSGLSFLDIDGKFFVNAVDEQSPAHKAGIRPNDQLLSLNGIPVASLPLKSIYQTLGAKPGNEIEMTIQRGPQTKSVKFRLKRLL